MKNFTFKISERHQVLLVIPIVIAAFVIIWALALHPQFERRREIVTLRAQLAKSPYASQSMDNLLKIAEQERQLGERTKAEWNETVKRLSTFGDQGDLINAPVGRIDYKMELFKVRYDLSMRSTQHGVQLVPQDLGLRDALGGNDDEIKLRWLQLKTVERLVDTILSRKVFKLHSISPLDPIKHFGLNQDLLFTEYPVDVDFEVAFEDLYLFFQSVLEENRIFFIRNLSVRAGSLPSAPLRIKAVMSSSIFE